MTEQELVKLIFCLCQTFMDTNDKQVCFEKYTNCAVVENGKILTKEEFDKQCNILPHQDRCYVQK